MTVPGELLLLVEDHPLSRDALRALLEAAGYRVACVGNGWEALEYLGRSEPPALILLDLSMPVMSGWEFRQRQRQDPGLARIPVVLLSGEADLEETAASLGAAGHFQKPVELSELLETIRVLA